MDKLFLTILNMSLTGSFVIASICLARLPLKKAPKIISYCLWAVAGFRLVFPFSLDSVFSLIPFNAETIPPNIAMQAIPRINSGISFVNDAVSSVLPPAATMTASINPLQVWIAIGTFLWLTGGAVMLIYGVVSFIILKRKMSGASHIETNIYEAGNIKSPFALGFFKPGIYLPSGLSEQERGYIILHEQTHIRRYDHIVKLAAYFILCLHWFNPLVWTAFRLLGVDMEMSCDECVLREIGSETKKDYSRSLLSLATDRHAPGSPLAFGEVGVKARIKNVLNFKKPSRVTVVSAVTLAALLSAGFALNKACNLIEFEAIYSDVTEYSYSVQFALGDTVYSLYIPDGRLQTSGGWRGLKEIGFARGGNGDKYRIFEREGHSIDEFIVVQDDGFMNPASIYIAGEQKTYSLENMTDKERFEHLSSVTLYSDGTARLAAPPISSYALTWPCYYTFENSELLIYYNIDDPFARFAIIDENTLQFQSATVPLFAQEGARYVSAPQKPSFDLNDVSIAFKKVDFTLENSGFTMIWKNVTNKMLTYGEAFSLEKRVNDEWINIGNHDNFAVAHQLPANSEINQIYPLNESMLDIDNGTYRIVTWIFDMDEPGSYREYSVSAEFTVDRY